MGIRHKEVKTMKQVSIQSLAKCFKDLELRVTQLESKKDKKNSNKNLSNSYTKTKKQSMDFSVNIRTFMKKYHKKSGAKKFVLLLAFLAQGKLENHIKISDIKKQWSKMSGKKFLGQFNNYYPNEAKTQGWVDSKKYGTYCLTKNWNIVL